MFSVAGVFLEASLTRSFIETVGNVSSTTFFVAKNIWTDLTTGINDQNGLEATVGTCLRSDTSTPPGCSAVIEN